MARKTTKLVVVADNTQPEDSVIAEQILGNAAPEPTPVFNYSSPALPMSAFGWTPTTEQKLRIVEEAEQDAVEAEAIAKALALVAGKKHRAATAHSANGTRRAPLSADAVIATYVGGGKHSRDVLYFGGGKHSRAIPMTVGEAIAAGIKRVDVVWDVNQGRILLAD